MLNATDDSAIATNLGLDPQLCVRIASGNGKVIGCSVPNPAGPADMRIVHLGPREVSESATATQGVQAFFGPAPASTQARPAFSTFVASRRFRYSALCSRSSAIAQGLVGHTRLEVLLQTAFLRRHRACGASSLRRTVGPSLVGSASFFRWPSRLASLKGVVLVGPTDGERDLFDHHIGLDALCLN